jgi:predicted dehydrogenase
MSVRAVTLPGGAATAPRQHGVAVVGCGLIGRRRAGVVAEQGGAALRALVDPDPRAAAQIAVDEACHVAADWRAALQLPDVDIVIVATPNAAAAEIAIAALTSGRHVLMEKPMGRGLHEAERIHAAAAASGRVLRVGFNHRFHPGIQRAAALIHAGAIGRLLTLRARYGHGGRPGLEHEWRSDPEQAGGGELLDQGSHVVDLFHWLAGMPTEAYGVIQTAAWPIAPLEDNAYGILRFPTGAVAQLHVSMTQWRNLFSLEAYGVDGAVLVEGLGGSYGPQRLTVLERAHAGGVPHVREEEFPAEDQSWALEWAAFLDAVGGHASAGGASAGGASAGGATAGGAADGVAAMRIIDALYRSARAGAPVPV